MKPVIPSSQHMAPVKTEHHGKNPLLWHSPNPPEGISSTDIVLQEVKCKCAIFLKELLNKVIIVGVENISCLILRFHKAEFARLDFSFASM